MTGAKRAGTKVLPLAVLSFLFLLILSPAALAQLEPVGDTVKDVGDTVGDTVEDTTGTVGDTAGDTGGSVGETVDETTGTDVGSTVGDTVKDVGDTVSETGGNAGNAVKDASNTTGDTVNEVTGTDTPLGGGDGATDGGGKDNGGNNGGGGTAGPKKDRKGDAVKGNKFSPAGKRDKGKAQERGTSPIEVDAPVPTSEDLGESTQAAAFAPAFTVEEAIRQAAAAAKAFAFPLALTILVVGFMLIQNRVDKKDPKLALAAVDTADELLSFG